MSFDSIEDKWRKELLENGDENIVLLLVGNKSDLEDRREVSFEEAQEFAEQRGIAFIETSALDSSKVELPFCRLSSKYMIIFSISYAIKRQFWRKG